MNKSYMNETENADLFDITTALSIDDGEDNYYSYGLVTNNLQYSLRQIFDTFVKMSICVLGTFANVTNIVVFAKIGLSDSMTVTFFGLAIADLGFVFITFMYQLSSNLDTITKVRPYLDLGDAAYVLNFYSFMFVDISTLITVFAAVQKCACVAIPLMFKNVFTRGRGIIVVSFVYLAMITYYIPMFMSNQLKPGFDTTLQRTRLRLYHTYFHDQVIEIWLKLNRIAIPFSSQIVVILCMVILTVKLLQASKLRQSMTNERQSLKGDNQNTKDKSQISAKEIRAIRVVALISAIFVACNLPDVVSTMFVEYTPDFDYLTYRLMRAVQNSLAVINSTINIVVYFLFNLKFRRMLLGACGSGCCNRGVE